MNYLIENNDKYICRYLEKDLVWILKDLSYHSEEWEETDDEEDDVITEESATKERTTSIHIYET